ncbi:MAG: OmpA family protein, partial [Saprospiraceae bacterium]
EYKISVTDNNKCIKVEKISIKLDKPIPPPTTGFADSLLIGETIRLSIFFEADSSNIENEHHIELEKLYTFLKNYPSIKIEISGHTNGLPEKEYCFWLSNSRIKSVSRFLEDKGIERDRLTLRAKGKSEPLASDRTAKGRRKNQRVEVRKISD